MMIPSIAYAMGPPSGSEGGNPLTAFLPLIIIFAIFYFLFLRKGRASKPSTSKLSPSEAGQLALAYLDGVHDRMVGNPVPLGVKLVTSELSRGRASRALVNTPEMFRLGVVNYFASLAMFDPDSKFLGIIKTQSETDSDFYRQERLASNGVLLQNYLSAFGISVLPTALADVQSVGSHLAAEKKILAVTSSAADVEIFKSAGRGASATVCIVEDDGTIAKGALF